MEVADVTQLMFKILLFMTDILLGLAIGVQIFLFRKVQANQTDLLKYKLEVAEKYATKEDYQKGLSRIESKLDDLFNDVHRKK